MYKRKKPSPLTIQAIPYLVTNSGIATTLSEKAETLKSRFPPP